MTEDEDDTPALVALHKWPPEGKRIKGDIGELTRWCKAAARCVADAIRNRSTPLQEQK